MKTQERRQKILEIIKEQHKPVSATAIASLLHVSRQIIVGDVALLRASGVSIIATSRGYILESKPSLYLEKTIAVVHDAKDLHEELYTIVEQGGGILDVIVEHPVYGQLCANLHLFSKYDVDQFIEKCKIEKASPLSILTQGVHLHTIRVHDEECYERILNALHEKGFLYIKNEVDQNA